jgi:hypothetical protein
MIRILSIRLLRDITIQGMTVTIQSLPDEIAITTPDEVKRQLCYDLLQEFGVTNIRENREGELTHHCTLNLGGHSDGNSWTASLNYKKLVFNCFVCGYGGSLQWWIAVNRGLETHQVEGWLKSHTGQGGQRDLATRMKIINSIIHPPDSRPEPMPFYNDAILNRWNNWDIFHPYLTDPWLPDERGGREIPEVNLKKYEIGYADEDEDFHYFRRIIIPIRWKGKIVGWQARRFDPRDPEYHIKYKNSPSFPRDRILYGDVQSRFAALVESPMSVLRHTHQYPIVSTLGSKLTETQLRLLQSFQRLVLFPDPDKAGYQWTRKILNSISRWVNLDVVISPYEKVDPSDLDDLTFGELIESAVPGALWQPKYYRDLIPYKGRVT